MVNKTHPRILIIGTVPYNTKSTSRAFDAYFHYWERDKLAQFFSDPKTPVKGHCASLFQITDFRLLQRWKGRNIETGRVYDYESLPSTNESDSIIDERLSARGHYQLGAKHTPITHLLRGLLWRKHLWCTALFLQWLDSFKPECVFLSFSDDYFILQIALFVAERFRIPIVSSIGDDYYFNLKVSINPLYWWYKLTYRHLVNKVLFRPGCAIYISNKIRDKYNNYFDLNGETVYLASTVQRKLFSQVNVQSPLITYFGNIRMGRNHSLSDIGNALGSINPHYRIEVYSGESDPEYYKSFQDSPFVYFGGTIPYEQVQEKMASSDITVIVEGFKKEDINCSRYSLSTKAADALASGATILTYGSAECGIVEYMMSTNASFVCTEKSELKNVIRVILDSPNLQKQYYDQQIIVTNEHHNLVKSCAIFEEIVYRAIKNYLDA